MDLSTSKISENNIDDDDGDEDRSSSSPSTTVDHSRTSKNAWIYRETDHVVDSIYRRAADLMRIDESLLRDRKEPGGTGKHLKTVAEPLQIVHYDPGQLYA